MSEEEVKIFMDENERLYAVTENGDRYILVPYEKDGVFAEWKNQSKNLYKHLDTMEDRKE